MPRILHRGEEGTRVVLSGLPFTQVPDVALKLSGNAFKLLGRLQRLAGSASSCEAGDQELGRWIRRSRQTVQRCWVELEAAGLVERRRRSNQRRIVLLYTLASRENRAEMVHACLTPGQTSEASACTTDEARMARDRGMQSPDPGRPSNSKQEEQQQQASGSAASVVVPLDLAEEEEPGPPSRPAFLASLVADLADALTGPAAKRPAPGPSPKEPRRPVVRDSVPDPDQFTKRDGQPSRPVHGMQHKNDYRSSCDHESERS